MAWNASLLWQFDILILLMMVICAVTALALEGLLSSAIVRPSISAGGSRKSGPKSRGSNSSPWSLR